MSTPSSQQKPSARPLIIATVVVVVVAIAAAVYFLQRPDDEVQGAGTAAVALSFEPTTAGASTSDGSAAAESASGDADKSDEASGSANTSATGASEESACSATGEPSDPSDVTVSGSFGDKPNITFPCAPPPDGLTITVLEQGDGPVAAPDEMVVVNYLGVVWGAETDFDNSYDKDVPFDFALGAGSVISGWDKGLVGIAAGSRILLTAPPLDGYGTSGNEAAGIAGTDTIVFVVDLLAVLGKDQFGEPAGSSATPPQALPGGITVSGEPGTVPSITIAPGTPEPTAITLAVVNYGSGQPVVDGPVYLQFGAWGWDGVLAGSTWETSGPSQVPSLADIPELAGLIGIPVGSRVLLLIPPAPEIPAAGTAEAVPAQSGQAYTIDIIYQAP